MGIKTLGQEAGHSPPCSAEIKNEELLYFTSRLLSKFAGYRFLVPCDYKEPFLSSSLTYLIFFLELALWVTLTELHYCLKHSILRHLSSFSNFKLKSYGDSAPLCFTQMVIKTQFYTTHTQVF